jgi:hypothetical protein
MAVRHFGAMRHVDLSARSGTSRTSAAGAGTVVRVGFSDRLQEAALAARTLSDGASDPAFGDAARRGLGTRVMGRVFGCAALRPRAEQIAESGRVSPRVIDPAARAFTV